MISLLQRCRTPVRLYTELSSSQNLCRQEFPSSYYCTDKAKDPKPTPEKNINEPKEDAEVPQNVHPHADKYRSSFQKENGEMYDNKPFKIRLKPNKEYFWCQCGRSHSQPLCDGTHRDAYRKTPLRPIRFMVKDDKEYWLCNCKHSKLRPFCDGTHKTLPPRKK